MQKKRVFVSVTSNKALDDRRKAVKAAILEKLLKEGYEPQEFWASGLPKTSGLSWSFENVDRVMRKCVGALVIGFPRWTFSDPEQEIRLVGEYNNYEGAAALSHGLSVFILAEEGVVDRGIVWTGGGRSITYIPADAQADWTESAEFQSGFGAWMGELNARKDIFLGYCGQNVGMAAQIETFLMREGATVLNYQMDFRAGGATILDEIARASARCSAGIFLFAENDPLEGVSGGAAPRDNVVFEAGYFMSTKGHDRCLIVRQGDAKMPADLGGAIYLHLRSSDPFSSIETRLRNFLNENL